MKTVNTAAKIVPVVADTNAWKFTATTAALDKHTFDATYSVARSGDVYVFASIGDTPVRIHIGKGMPTYHEALEAAMAAKNAAKQPATQAESKPVEQPKPAEQPAKQAGAKPEAKPAPAAKQPKAAKPAKQAAPADKAWIGTTLTGKGWRIAFDEATQRTRVSFDADPSAKQKSAVEAAGFYFSAQLKSWNKKLTCKAYRAALALADTLNALA
ncbi:MAG: hypothetical protein IKN04_11715 [Clostridia bacterium]|nr:hypothetical protein [Clostridia bacterium]